MLFGSPEHLTFLRYEVLSPQRRYSSYIIRNKQIYIVYIDMYIKIWCIFVKIVSYMYIYMYMFEKISEAPSVLHFSDIDISVELYSENRYIGLYAGTQFQLQSLT